MAIDLCAEFDLCDAALTGHAVGIFDYVENYRGVIGRALAWRNRPAPPPSDLLTPAAFEDILSNRRNNGLLSNDPDFEWFKQKAISKWIGAQGIPPKSPEEADSIWQPYFTTRNEWKPLPHRVEKAFQKLLKTHQTRSSGKLVRSYSQVVASGEVTRKMGNSGLTYFTSDTEIILANLGSIARLARAIERGEAEMLPEMQSYRSQRNKLRSVFNSNTATLLYQRAKLGTLINGDEKLNTLIKYCPSMTVMKRIFDWWKSRSKDFKFPIFAVEGDAEAMDINTQLEVCKYIERLVIDVLYPHISPDEIDQVMRCLDDSFKTRLVTLNAQLVIPHREHTLLSGQYPTNGLENHISIAVFVLFCHLLDLTIHGRETVDFDKMVFESFLIVCGDDVGALMELEPGKVGVVASVYAQAYEWLGLKARADKQRVSDHSLFFCKEQYPIPGNLGYKGWVYDHFGTGLPFPRYPLELALNSCTYPEEGPQYEPADEAKAICYRLENGKYDPAFKVLAPRLQTQYHMLSTDLLIGAVQSKYTPNSWEEKIYGLTPPELTSLSSFAVLRKHSKSNW